MKLFRKKEQKQEQKQEHAEINYTNMHEPAWQEAINISRQIYAKLIEILKDEKLNKNIGDKYLFMLDEYTEHIEDKELRKLTKQKVYDSLFDNYLLNAIGTKIIDDKFNINNRFEYILYNVENNILTSRKFILYWIKCDIDNIISGVVLKIDNIFEEKIYIV